MDWKSGCDLLALYWIGLTLTDYFLLLGNYKSEQTELDVEFLKGLFLDLCYSVSICFPLVKLWDITT